MSTMPSYCGSWLGREKGIKTRGAAIKTQLNTGIAIAACDKKEKEPEHKLLFLRLHGYGLQVLHAQLKILCLLDCLLDCVSVQ